MPVKISRNPTKMYFSATHQAVPVLLKVGDSGELGYKGGMNLGEEGQKWSSRLVYHSLWVCNYLDLPLEKELIRECFLHPTVGLYNNLVGPENITGLKLKESKVVLMKGIPHFYGMALDWDKMFVDHFKKTTLHYHYRVANVEFSSDPDQSLCA